MAERTKPSPVFQLQGYSQEDLAHGAGVAMHFPIQVLDGVVLPGAGKSSVPYVVTVFTAQLLPNEGGFKNQVTKYWKAPPTLSF